MRLIRRRWSGWRVRILDSTLPNPTLTQIVCDSNSRTNKCKTIKLLIHNKLNNLCVVTTWMKERDSMRPPLTYGEPEVVCCVKVSLEGDKHGNKVPLETDGCWQMHTHQHHTHRHLKSALNMRLTTYTFTHCHATNSKVMMLWHLKRGKIWVRYLPFSSNTSLCLHPATPWKVAVSVSSWSTIA